MSGAARGGVSWTWVWQFVRPSVAAVWQFCQPLFARRLWSHERPVWGSDILPDPNAKWWDKPENWRFKLPRSLPDDFTGTEVARHGVGSSNPNYTSDFIPFRAFSAGRLVGEWEWQEVTQSRRQFSRLFYRPSPSRDYPYGWVWNPAMTRYEAVQSDPNESPAPRPLEQLPRSDTYGDNTAMSHDQLKAIGAAHSMRGRR